MGECTQWIKVVDETGEPIESANVQFDNENVELTSHDGRLFTSLEEESSHTVKVWKKGYDCLNCKKTFTACTDEIVLSLTKNTLGLKPSETDCTQWFKVIDDKGAPIEGATVKIGGINFTTGADGKVSGFLIEGTRYTVIAEKEGYDCLDCKKTFTACIEEIVLILKTPSIKPPVKPVKPAVKKCIQRVKVVDEKGIPIKDAYTGFFTDGIFTRPRSGADGIASASLEEGKRYRLFVEREGYEPSEEKFTACTKEIVVTLKKKPSFCTQSFKTVDEEGKPIADAHVSVVGVIDLVTEKEGKCSYDHFEEGKVYTVEAQKVHKDYRVVAKTTFTACTEEIVLTLKKPQKCTQWIKVVDENDEPIEAANVIFDTEVELLTSHDGRVFTSFEEGSRHIVKTWKEGYECEDFEKSFVACTGRKRIIFYLKKIKID